jgi:transposase InsO family protein
VRRARGYRRSGPSLGASLRDDSRVAQLNLRIVNAPPAPVIGTTYSSGHNTLLRGPVEAEQYTAVLFTKRCAKAGIEISMGSVGDCYDNAVCETFHASLKKERIYRQSWPTRAQARTAIFEYIEGWYNPRRRHSTLGYLSPIEFERERASTASVDFVAAGSMSPDNALAVPAGPAQAATNGEQGTNSNGWPLRPVVKEQAR